MATNTFDSDTYKQSLREEWREAAPGWFRWIPTLQGDDGVTKILLDRARIAAGNRVLDVATGYGEPGLSAAALVGPEGHVTCLDIAGDMLAFAERRAQDAGIDHVEFVEGDFEDLRGLGSDRFDAVISRAGLMYAVDPAATVGRLRTHLRPGGRLAVSVWSTAEKVAFALPVGVMVEMLGIEPAGDGPGVFALAEPGLLRSHVVDAGFEDVAEEVTTVIFEVESPAACTQFVRDVAPPITQLIADRPADAQDDVWAQVTKAWAPFVGDDGRVRLPCEAIIVSATNPQET